MAEGAVIRYGRVVGIDDEHGGGRIQARTVFDNPVGRNDEVNWYIPLLPKMFYVKPKVGEMVLLISMAAGAFNQPSFYIGPIISQEDKLFYENYDEAGAITEQWPKAWDPNPREKKNVLPTLYPGPEDVAIEGRKDTGIQLKDDEVRIKAGVKLYKDGKVKNNTENPSFISLKYYPNNDQRRDGFKSTATIVADKINLIGGNSNDLATKDIPVKGNDPAKGDDLISESAMKELVDKAHQIPYGDKLIEFLDLLRTALAKHVHPFPTMAPCNDENMKAVATYDLNDTLSDTVRIN